MPLKLFGSLCLLMAGTLAAHTCARYEKQKLSVLDAWITLIDTIREEIDCYLLPLDDILASIDRTLILDCMCAKTAPSLEDLLRSSLLYLEPEAKRLISSFVREIGKSNREEQVRRCSYYVTGLQNVRERMKGELSGKIRVGSTLSLGIAAAVTILLW